MTTFSSTTTASGSPAGPRLSPWLARYGLVVALVLLCAILSLTTSSFFSTANLINVVRQISINGILAVGVTLVLLTGGVDLSLGSVVALAGVVAACVARLEAGVASVAWWVAIAATGTGVLTGAGCGCLNGVVVAKGRVAPFIVTLGMMTAARGLALVVSSGKPVSDLSPQFIRLGSSEIAGIPVMVLLLVIVALAFHLFLQNFRLGRYLYAVGGNEHAARASGLRVDAIKIFAYTVCGALAGLAGAVLASRVTTGQPNAGVGYELDAIAAVVIGGTSLSGGVGSVRGTILGALLMGVINNGLDLLNVSSYYQQIVKGLIIVGAVWLERRSQR